MKKTSQLTRLLAALSLSALSLVAYSHGDEPHGDAPHPVAGAEAAARRFEAVTENFELAGQLDSNALTLFINRFATSEPVSQATVELESGDLKAVANYQSTQGSYTVSDPRLMAALSQPGTHPLVIMVTAGKEADLLEATLTVPPAMNAAAASIWPAAAKWGGAAALLALAIGLTLAARRRARMNKKGLWK